MDDIRFDAMTRTLGGMSTRRAALNIAGATSGAAALGRAGILTRKPEEEGQEQGQEPLHARLEPLLRPTRRCCSKNCCYNPYTDYHFCEDRSLLVCCSEDIQGACALENPVCCPTNQFEPVPYCCYADEVCCEGGCCFANRVAGENGLQAARSRRGVPQFDIRPGRS